MNYPHQFSIKGPVIGTKLNQWREGAKEGQLVRCFSAYSSSLDEWQVTRVGQVHLSDGTSIQIVGAARRKCWLEIDEWMTEQP